MKYNFYDYVIVDLNTKRKDYINYFNNEFKGLPDYNPAVKDAPVIHLNIVNKLPDDTYPNDIRRTLKFKNLFTISYLVRDIETRDVKIYFVGNIVDKIYLKAISVFTQTELLEPVLFAKLLEQDILLMHSAGVAKDGKGYIFPAHGGTGKTTLSLNLCRKGYSLLGDDLLLMDYKKATVLPYPRPLHLFSYNINTLPDARIKPGLRLAIKSKDVIRVILGAVAKRKFLISTRVHVKELYPNISIAGPSSFEKLIFLRKEGGTKKVVLKGDNHIKEKVIDDIVRSADLNKSLYNEILNERKDYADAIAAKERKTLSGILDCFDEMTYINTRKLPVDEVIKLLKD